MGSSDSLTQDRNEYFSKGSLKEYIEGYAKSSSNSLTQIPLDKLNAAYVLLNKAHVIYVAGNGGSSAIADHWACDFHKGLWRPGSQPPPRVINLTAHAGLCTAISNDWGYAEVFSKQLEMRGRLPGELLIVISSSGNSENVVKAVEMAKSLNIPTLGFTGFSGGKLLDLCDVCIHIPVNNYGLVEDVHQSLMHCFAQYRWLTQSGDIP
jgi:phosphoheptose isomerase